MDTVCVCLNVLRIHQSKSHHTVCIYYTSMFAKLSLVLSTMHYIYSNKSIKSKLKVVMNQNQRIVFGTASNNDRLIMSRQRNIHNYRFYNNINNNNNLNQRPF